MVMRQVDSALRRHEFATFQQTLLADLRKLGVVDAQLTVDLKLFAIQTQPASLLLLEPLAFSTGAHSSIVYESIDFQYPGPLVLRTHAQAPMLSALTEVGFTPTV